MALRVFVGFGLLSPVWGSGYQQAAGLEVVGVGEAVGCSSEDLEEVVGSLCSPV